MNSTMNINKAEIPGEAADKNRKSHMALISSLTKELLTITELDNLL